MSRHYRRGQLGANDKKIVRRSSRERVEESLREITHFFPRDRWLSTANVYGRNAVRRIYNDVKKRHRPPIDRDLRHYVAASTITHCADAWAFYGRAVDCVAHGDVNSARHLAYYAELRATLSLLATEGIGVFDQYHFVVSEDGSCQQLAPRGTHNEAWLLLSYWMKLPRSGALLGKIIAPGGVSIAELLGQFGNEAITVDLVLNRWLGEWGLDLYRMHRDRAARNYVSYRPTALTPSLAEQDIARDMGAVENLWRLGEPRESPFEALDRGLLLLGTLEVFRALHAPALPQTRPEAYRKRISYMLEHVLLPSGIWADSIEAYLFDSATTGTIPRLLQEASGSLGIGEPGQHIQVLGRALLLLRLATGSCSLLARGAEIAREDLRFWWEPLGRGRGLWAGEFDQDFEDLWSDVEDELGELQMWGEAGPCSTSSLRRLDSSAAGMEPAGSIVGSCERLMLWGLAL